MSSFSNLPEDSDDPIIPDWDDAPTPIETDLSKMDGTQITNLLKSHIDEEKARRLVQQLDGAADDYERNIQRIQKWLAGIQQVVGTAIKIAAVV